MSIIVLWLLVMAGGWYAVLDTPHTIELTDGGTVEFISLLRRRVLRVNELTSIKRQLSRSDGLVFRERGGNVIRVRQFADFRELIARIGAENPAVIIQ